MCRHQHVGTRWLGIGTKWHVCIGSASMHMVISTDNKKRKTFLPRNVSGLFKYSINILGVINIYICWSLVCLFLKNLVQKRKHQKAKGPGSSQISRLRYRSWGSFCFQMKSRLEMASRRPGQEWGLLPSHGHCLPICLLSWCPSLFIPFSFLLPVFSLTPSLLFHFLFVLSFSHVLPWLKFCLAWIPQHCCLYFIYFCIQLNNCLHTFLYLIILV